MAEAEKIRRRPFWHDIWHDYLERHDVLHGHTDDLVEVYNDDPAGFGNRILIRCPSSETGYLRIPVDFAEKVLFLGFPDDVVEFAKKKQSDKTLIR